MHRELSFNGANYVARQAGWNMTGGWGQGVRTTREWFSPVETFEERFDGLLADIQSLGFDLVDLWQCQLDSRWATDAHVEAAGRVLGARGMRVASYGGGPYGETPEEFEACCRLLDALGVREIAGYCALGDTDRAAMLRLLERYDLVYDRENHAERTPEELRALVGDPAGGRLGVTVDTGWFGTQGYPAPQAIRELGDLVGFVHLKDVLAAGEHETCRFGEGVVDLAGCLDALDDIGYTGPLSIEHEPELFDPSADIAASAELTRVWLAERGR